MAKILIIGQDKTERHCLALFMEVTGHTCGEADSVDEAKQMMAEEREQPYEIILAEARVGDSETQQAVEVLKRAAPEAKVLVLTEEGSPTFVRDEVTTGPLSSMKNYPAMRKGDAFLALLPERDALKMLGDLPQTAGFLNKLALLYHSQQKYAAAEQLYRRALELSASSTDASREAASILMNLGSLQEEQGKHAEAEVLFKESLAAAERVYGPNHIKVSRRLRRLVEVYRAQGKTRDAAPLHARLQGISEAWRN